MGTIVFVLLKHDEPVKTLHLVISLTASNQSVCTGRLGCCSAVFNQLSKLQFQYKQMQLLENPKPCITAEYTLLYATESRQK